MRLVRAALAAKTKERGVTMQRAVPVIIFLVVVIPIVAAICGAVFHVIYNAGYKEGLRASGKIIVLSRERKGKIA